MGVKLTDYVDASFYNVVILKETTNAYLFQFFKSVDPTKPTKFWASKKIIYDLIEGEEHFYVALPDWFDFAKYIDRR